MLKSEIIFFNIEQMCNIYKRFLDIFDIYCNYELIYENKYRALILLNLYKTIDILRKRKFNNYKDIRLSIKECENIEIDWILFYIHRSDEIYFKDRFDKYEEKFYNILKTTGVIRAWTK